MINEELYITALAVYYTILVNAFLLEIAARSLKPTNRNIIKDRNTP